MLLPLQYFLLFFLIHINLSESIAIFTSILSLLNFGGKWGLTAFTGFLGFHGSEVLFSLMKGDPDKFSDLQKEMHDGFEKLNDQILISSEIIVNRLAHQIHSHTEFNRVFHHIEEYKLTILTQFKNLQQLLQNEQRYQNDTLYKTADYLTSTSEGTVHSAMYKLDSLINEKSFSLQLSRGAIMSIINYLNALHDLKHCTSIIAPIEVMYVFLHYLIMLQLKGMVTIQEAFSLLERINKIKNNQTRFLHYSEEFHRIEQTTAEHIKNLLQNMKNLKQLSPYSYACMPNQYIKHENYERFEQFLPIYLTNEYGLEHSFKKRTLHATMYCSEDCSWYNIASFDSNLTKTKLINYLNRCWGMIHNCDLANITGKLCLHDVMHSSQMYTKYQKTCKNVIDVSNVYFVYI